MLADGGGFNSILLPTHPLLLSERMKAAILEKVLSKSDDATGGKE